MEKKHEQVAEDQALKRRKMLVLESEVIQRQREAARRDYDDGITTRAEYVSTIQEIRARERALYND